MKTIILNLRGLQSWGASSKHVQRETRNDPTFSGVIGMICSAAGIRPESPEAESLRQLSLAVRVQTEGKKLCDYQTVKGFRNIMDAGEAQPIQTWRYYLSDACFLVALSGKDKTIEMVESCLKHPRYHLYLGRLGFPLCSPLVLCTVDERDPFKALKGLSNAFLSEKMVIREKGEPNDRKRYVVVSKKPSINSENVRDVFTTDGYDVRTVDHIYV